MKQRFFHSDVDIIQRTAVYQGFFQLDNVRFKHRLFKGGWSPEVSRELLIRGAAVAAVLYDPRHQLIGLVEQFRIGALDRKPSEENRDESTSPWCYEVVAGISEPNEPDDEVILRELQEEAGIVPDSITRICEYMSSPGGSDETLTLYCAVADLSLAGGVYGLENEMEDIRMVVLPEDEVFSSLYNGRYNNAATLIGLQWLQLNKDRLTLSG